MTYQIISVKVLHGVILGKNKKEFKLALYNYAHRASARDTTYFKSLRESRF